MPRIALALFLTVIGLGTVQAAAEPVAEPLPPDACGVLRKDFAAALGFPLTLGTRSRRP